MAQIKAIEITGEELERRIRVTLEYSIQETEAFLNNELMRRLADKIATEYFKKKHKELMANLKTEALAKEVTHAIVVKAVLNLAMENANGNR